ncbi:MAG: glycoside hydrolase family 20 zincin-like fold domain-containing protein [Sphaerochaetaceae bacterium]
MINLIPEPKRLKDFNGYTDSFLNVFIDSDDENVVNICKLRFWNYRGIIHETASGKSFSIDFRTTLEGFDCDEEALFKEQGYSLSIRRNRATISYEGKSGLINGITSLKMLISKDSDEFRLPICDIVDWPSVAVRAVAPTFSWYAGYGRIGFDSQLWGYDEWVEFMNISLDNKINQFNMVMYGYWPFDFDEYPETTLHDIPVKIWNEENRRWLQISYTHPNIVDPYLSKLIELGHSLEFKFFAYVGLNSYNGGYSIKHPEARMKAPETGNFLNDFDSLCLSHEGTVDYILASMRRIAQLGFDGFTLEESEEGFWFCECDDCKRSWHAGHSPVEAKHAANIWLLNKIWDEIRLVNPDVVLGIRAFRQPPLEKDPLFLEECVQTMPKEVNLFWAPGLYVPETEFPKWVKAFGKEHIWGRDTEANSITSTMGRLYRTFKSNMIRYEDEANVQVIETDIKQHIGSVDMHVHGINGFMFEWFGLFLHEFAHGNYGWGSKMDPDKFFRKACELNFGKMGEKVLYVMRNILTIHESQMPFYKTPFPFQKNKIKDSDIPRILEAKKNHPHIMELLREIQDECSANPWMRHWLPHFDKLMNAEQRNAVIYDMVLASLRYESEPDPILKDKILDEILCYNEKDFNIAAQMFFDVNPVGETGVKSCMFPYHEIKREIHNIRHPESIDDDVICSGIEALGWLWL